MGERKKREIEGCRVGTKGKGVDLYPWLGGGVIGAKIFSAMDQSNQEVEAYGRLHLRPQARSTLPKGLSAGREEFPPSPEKHGSFDVSLNY